MRTTLVMAQSGPAAEWRAVGDEQLLAWMYNLKRCSPILFLQTKRLHAIAYRPKTPLGTQIVTFCGAKRITLRLKRGLREQARHTMVCKRCTATALRRWARELGLLGYARMVCAAGATTVLNEGGRAL